MGRPEAFAIQTGEFRRVGQRVFLVTPTGGRWASEAVRVLQPYSSATNRLPRPYVYDDKGNVVVRGDQVAFFFAFGNTNTPVVVGYAPYLGQDGYSGEDSQQTEQPFPILDGQGAEVGRTTVTYNPDGQPGATVSTGGTLQRTVKGEALLEALVTLATDLLAVAAAVPLVIPDTTALLAKLQADLAGGTEILTTTLKTD